MTTTDTPWEPPLAGTEAEHLVAALDRLRTTFRWNADALDAGGLQARIATSSLTLGGLLKHLAVQEGLRLHHQADRRPGRRPVGRHRLGRRWRLGVHLRRQRHP